jgi:DHA2 family multidrug resistance protein-like MFS transporter
LTVAVFFAVGPTVASGVLSMATWPWLFLINIPLGLFAIGLAFRRLPDSVSVHAAHHFDTVAAVLLGGMFAVFILGLDEATQDAWPVRVLGEWVTSLVCCGLLLYRERAHPAPLFPVDLFRRPLFTLSPPRALPLSRCHSCLKRCWDDPRSKLAFC